MLGRASTAAIGAGAAEIPPEGIPEEDAEDARRGGAFASALTRW